MKLFKVRIDTSPGEWKSGEDHLLLVPANSAEEAEAKVWAGWGEKYDFETKQHVYGQGTGFDTPYLPRQARLYAYEVTFQNLDLVFTNDREQKLKRILYE